MGKYERDDIRRMQGYTWGEQPEDGNTIKLNGRTKFGLMVNVTEYTLGGDSVGNGRALPFANGQAFSSGETHTHISPLFEQEVHFDLNVIDIIPILKRCSWLDKARIHVGYSVVLLWEVGRPQYTIDYRGQPLNPVLLPNLASRRTQWYTHGWDFGLIWEW